MTRGLQGPNAVFLLGVMTVLVFDNSVFAVTLEQGYSITLFITTTDSENGLKRKKRTMVD